MESHLGLRPMETSDEEDEEEDEEQHGTGGLDPSLRSIILRRVRRRNAVAHNPALLRLTKDLHELRSARGVEVECREGDAWGLLVHVRPGEGFYSASLSGDDLLRYGFRVAVGSEYPFEPPTVTCLSPWPALYHPNIDPATGRVGLELLMCDWTPIMSLGGVLDALLGLLEEPVWSGPSVLNAEAAHELRHAPQRLVAKVQQQQQALLASERMCFARVARGGGNGDVATEAAGSECDDDEDEDCVSRLKRREQQDKSCLDHLAPSPKRCVVVARDAAARAAPFFGFGDE